MSEQSASLPESGICLVVVNYGSSNLIKPLLGDLSPASGDVVVVDNFSSQSERRAVRALSTELGWHLVEPADNRGFGAGVNAGVARARSLGHQCFLLLNPDVVVTSDVIAAMRRTVLDDHLALVSPILIDNGGTLSFAGSTLDLADGRIRGRSSYRLDPGPGVVPWLTAACLAVHEELWERVDGFDESYFMYWEDVDFGYRCLEQGARLVLRADLQATHDQGGTQGRQRGRAKSNLYYYFNVRNRMLFAALHLDRRAVRGWLRHTPAVSWEILLRGGRRQLIESPRVGFAALRGLLAALLIGLRALVGRRAFARASSS